MRRATTRTQSASLSLKYFYPRSPCGERPNLQRNQHQKKHISIHALLAESDITQKKRNQPGKLFLSTLSLRRATFHHSGTFTIISHFYPRSPCGERPGTLDPKKYDRTFLSTLSLRRATVFPCFIIIDVKEHFYPRSPCGERLLTNIGRTLT